MSYIEGFVIAAPRANKQKFIDHAQIADGIFIAMDPQGAEFGLVGARSK